jgi:MFS family permease
MRLSRHWLVAGAIASAILISAGTRMAPGVFLPLLTNEFGWSRESLGLSVAVGLVLYGLAGPFVGSLINRIGTRNTAIIGLVLIALSAAVGTTVTNEITFALWWGAVSGLGTGVVGGVLGAAVAMRWFVARRGFVQGIFGAATSAGQLLFVPLLALIGAAQGWRAASLLLAAITALLIIPVVWLVRTDPADVGLTPYGGEAPPPNTAHAEAGVMRRAVRTPDFWLLASTFFICGATSNGLIGTHLMAHALEHGFTTDVAAGVLALMGTMNFIGTLASGWLTDRYSPRLLLAAYYGFRGLSLLFLPFVHDPLQLSIFAVLFGLDYIATVPPTVALTSEVFGARNVGLVYGWIFFAHQMGAAIAAWLGGYIRDHTGDYLLAFFLAGVTAVIGSALAARINLRRTSAPSPA